LLGVPGKSQQLERFQEGLHMEFYKIVANPCLPVGEKPNIFERGRPGSDPGHPRVCVYLHPDGQDTFSVNASLQIWLGEVGLISGTPR